MGRLEREALGTRKNSCSAILHPHSANKDVASFISDSQKVFHVDERGLEADADLSGTLASACGF